MGVRLARDVAGTVLAAGTLVARMGWDRLVLALAVLAAVTYLTVVGRVDSEAAIGIYSALVGYVVGAGHEAAKGSQSSGG